MPRTSLLTRPPRQGTNTSSSFDVSTTANEVVVRADIHPDDYTVMANSLTLSVEVFDEARQVWRFERGLTWQGGNSTTKSGFNAPPSKFLDSAEYRGKTVRVVLDVPSPMRIGAVVDVA